MADDFYIDINRASWDERAPAHAASPDYAFDKFVADPDFLSDVVRFDLPLLGDVRGLRGVHLQCHIGTAVLDAGMQVTGLTEHDSVPWEALPGQMEQIGGGEWRVADRPWRLAHTYTLQTEKRS